MLPKLLNFLRLRSPPPPPPPPPAWPVAVLRAVERTVDRMGTEMWLGLVIAFVTIVFVLISMKKRRAYPKWSEIDPSTLKVGGTKKRLEALSGNVDVVIIGSGLSGLTTAAVLSRVGYKVVVVEQHDVAGGATHSFEDGGFEFDVGIHYIGGYLHSFLSPMRRLWAVVSDGSLEWTASDPAFDVCYDAQSGLSLPFTKYGTGDAALAKHYAHLPGAAAALRAYWLHTWLGVALGGLFLGLKALPPYALACVWPLFGPLWRRFGCAPVATVLARCGFVGPLAPVAGALTYCYGDYGVAPKSAPWFLHALVTTHYRGGAFFPTGGSASVAKTLVAAIVRRGGHVFVRAPVDSILLEKGRAVGVVCRGVTLRARTCVVSAAGFRNTFGSSDRDTAASPALLPAAVAKPTRALLQRAAADAAAAQAAYATANTTTTATSTATATTALSTAATPPPAPPPAPASREALGASIAMVYLFVGLDASDEDLDIKARNVWRLNSLQHDASFEQLNALDLATANKPRVPTLNELPAVFVGAASAKDGSWAARHPSKAALTVLAPCKAEWFERWATYKDGNPSKIKNRGAEYREYKDAWASLLLEALYEHYPKTRGHVAYTDIATPLSSDFYLGTKGGETYGLENSQVRFASRDAARALHPKTPIAGLYLTGQDTVVVGVATALCSGVFTAAQISSSAMLRLALDLVLA